MKLLFIQISNTEGIAAPLTDDCIKLLQDSINLAKKSHVPSEKIVLDPAIGFFRKSGSGSFFTKIKSDWLARDLSIIQNLKSIKMNYPILISVSNKSFICTYNSCDVAITLFPFFNLLFILLYYNKTFSLFKELFSTNCIYT